ncbi:MAG: protein kinase [Myxococcales bacterium]|nr:protein kinase [Myxococcales bacterium]
MGEVYLARHQSTVPGFASLAVIKILIKSLSTNPSFVQMFLDEARIVSKLQHKNIVQVRDVGEFEGQFYMVMEYIPGQNLRELLGDASIIDRPLFAPRLGAEVFAEIASALAAAHHEHLVHRDISPNNIMISDDGVAKLIDFGVAKAMSSTSLTKPGTLKGKFSYMAPEYVKSQAYDHRVDLFSLGVVMWETFARRRLFRGPSAAEQLHQLLETPIPPLDEVVPDFPRDLATVVAAALERDPQRRISSAMLLADSLAEVARSLPFGPDATLRKWLENRIPDRMRDRRQTDQMLASLPHGSPIPDFGLAFPEAGSVPGSYGYQQMGYRPALGEPDATRPLSAPAPIVALPNVPTPRSRMTPVLIGFLAGVAAIAVVFAMMRTGSSEAKQPQAMGSAFAQGSLADVHRQLGLRAMADGDMDKARRDFAEAMRLGAGGDVAKLLEMATAEAEAKHPEPIETPPTTVAGAPTGDATAPTTEPATPTETAAPEAIEPEPAAATLPTATPARLDPPPERANPRTGKTTPPRAGRTEKVTAATRPEPAVAQPPAPEPPAPATLTVTSIVPDAQVYVDGQFVGETPRKLQVSPDADHALVVKDKGGETLLSRNVKIAAGADKIVLVETKPKPAPTVAAAPAPAPVAAVAQPARTPRVSEDGSVASGASVVRACNACHAKTGASAFGGRRYTRAQWERFFASGQHDRYVGIGDKMGASELRAARAFLRANAADSAEHQGAGVQE